ncbi:hypothetical protein BH23PLA1_BH23PLA1_29620 [soil metagenome]
MSPNFLSVLCVSLILPVLIGRTASAEVVSLHVASDGRDDWSGSRERPAEDGSDGPLASLAAARDAIRRLKAENEGALPGPVRVLVQSGHYELEGPLHLTPEDSGTAEAPITYSAHPDSDGSNPPIISGGRTLEEWTVEPDGTWTTTVARDLVGFRHMYVGDKEGRYQRRYRPTVGAFVIAGLTDAPIKPGATMAHVRSQKEFLYYPEDLGLWALAKDVELVVLHDWSASRMRIESIDRDRNVVRMTAYPQYRVGHWWAGGRNPYALENVAHAFGEPGVWWMDPESRRLRYTPTEEKAGSEPGSPDCRIIISKLDQILIIEGDARAERFVEHVRFKGLVFSHTHFGLPAEGYTDGQGMTSLPAAVEAKGVRACSWTRCGFEHTGGYAIRLGEGCSENAVEACTMHDLGGGGVLVGVKDRRAEPPILPVGNRIEENRITNLGRDHFSAHGLWVGIAAETVLRHNHVADSLYSTVSVGWVWNDGPSSVRDNIVEANHLERAMRLLADGGGIYTLGRQPSSVLRGNHIHGVERSKFTGSAENNGFFFDEGTRDLLVERNVIYDTANALIRFNQSQASWQDFRDNAFGIEPGEEGFPEDVVEAAGPTKPAWRLAPKSSDPPILALPLPEPDSGPIVLDFEAGPNAPLPLILTASGTTETATISVTDEQAASGRHSLKVVDDSTPNQSWNPHLYIKPVVPYKMTSATFSLLRGAGAELTIECRQYGDGSYEAGPSIKVHRDGRLFASGKEVAKLPVGDWARFEIQHDPEGSSPESYSLRLKVGDQPSMDFQGLPLRSSEYRRLDWFGLMSDGIHDTVWYLDDVRIGDD